MSIQHTFPPIPDSVREARLFVLRELPSLTETTRDQINLIVSELATNAVLHAETTFTVALQLTRETLTIEVTDQDNAQPAPASDPPSPDQLHGRGLLIVTHLATEWGITPNPQKHGKTVWVKLILDARNTSEAKTKERPPQESP